MALDCESLSILKHRGPDRQAIWHETHDSTEVYLAHTRLSIVDLSEAGNQPMVSNCGNYVLILNGEIYNHLDLRKEMFFKDFKGHSDTETLLYYLIEKGVDYINNLNGVFAFALWNRQTGDMILARDKFGVKPLYYFQNGKSFVFASEIRPIRKFVSLNIDLKAFSILLALRHVPSPYTLFQNIMKLRPGHYMEINVRKDKLNFQICNYDLHHVNYSKLTFDEAVVEYGRKLNAAVNRQMMSDVDLGILLSGGVDSALVARAVSDLGNKDIQTFTVGFDSKYVVNELDYAAKTAKHFGMKHNTIKIAADSFFEIFKECSGIVEEPLATTSFIPMYYLSKLSSQKVKVVLTGQGADEPLGGYGRYQGEILHDMIPKYVREFISFFVKLSHSKNETLYRGANSLPINDDITRFIYTYSLFYPDEIARLLGNNDIMVMHELISYYYNSLNCLKYETSAERMMAIDQRVNLADDLLLYTDKITMHFSMECRVPLLDHELVKFVDSLPLEYKVKRGKNKIIHKAYAQSVLPTEIVNRPKLGFQSPTNIWFNEHFGEIKEMLIGDSSYLLNYLDKKEIENILHKHKIGYNKEKQIFLLISLNYWLENFH